MATPQVTTDSKLSFPAKGSLKRYAFPRIMREVARNKLTGSLYLLNDQTKKVVFFEEGKPVFVRSNVLSECLGQILSSEGLITQEQCEQTLEAIRRTGKKQGELLVEMGILSEGNLRYGLEAQLRAKLFDIFSWDDGRYQFKKDPLNQGFGIRLKLSAEGVIIGALQDVFSEDRARTALGPYLDKYPVARGEVTNREELDLLPEELYLIESLDGSRTVKECIATPPQPPVPTPHALLYGLLQSGLVQLSDKALPAKNVKPAPDLTPSPPPDDELAPQFEAQDVVTEYEDTPLPGELPKVRGLLGDHEADFADVEDEAASTTSDSVMQPPPMVTPVGSPTYTRPEVSEELVAAEPEQVEETFDDDQIELSPDDDIDVEEVDLESVELLEADATHAEIESDLHLTDSDISVASEAPQAEVTEMSAGGVAATDPNLAEAAAESDLSADETIDAQLLNTGDLIEEAVADLDSIDLPDLGEDLMTDDELDDIDLDDGGGDDLAATSANPLGGVGPSLSNDELVSFDELDDIDLGAEDEPVSYDGPESTVQEDSNPEMVGAIRFNEAETALADSEYSRAVELLEEAYSNGFDVAELHAMLAYSRFMASDNDADTAKHAFELLDYAQNMDPSLDLVHAYRGAIHQALQQPQQAKEALDRALELNPYCELAIELMDRL
jgi:tetratricopeptide (TPR) repeat protein